MIQYKKMQVKLIHIFIFSNTINNRFLDLNSLNTLTLRQIKLYKKVL